MIFFCVPTDFSENSIELLKNLNESHKNKKVCEVYGNLNPSKFGSGRHDKFLPKISLNQLESYINGLKKVDIEFNYTLNNLCFNNLETLQEGKKKIFEFIEILWNIGVEKITVANPYVLNFINSHFPDIKITASSIAHINSLMKVKEFMKIGASRIILFEDKQRDFSLIQKIMQTNPRIELELFLNSNCLFNCAFRDYHRIITSHPRNSQPWLNKCKIKRLKDPVELLKARGWIRPEDIKLYHEMGIKYYKIVGRENCRIDFEHTVFKTIKIYFKESFKGNFIDLITNFNKNSYLHKFCIENELLDDFLRYFYDNPNISKSCDEGCLNCRYCYDVGKKVIKLNQETDGRDEDMFRKKVSDALKVDLTNDS